MFLEFCKLLFLTAREWLRRLGVAAQRESARAPRLPIRAWWLPALFADARCARRVEALALRLTRMGSKIESLRVHVRGASYPDSVDSDAGFLVMLTELKQDMRALRCEVAGWQCDSAALGSARLQRALAAIAVISERIFTQADQLLWELAERGRVRGLPA